ncbi:uncharacterized protein LOC141910804 isoform X2 [Tubulanus polymorphus]|uniref:uncharacterized protein LOC141910804 isoform X2 n=1 Tax=Tubulanus polymorphus TaxID=672921 RepID=UPI003DA5470C
MSSASKVGEIFTAAGLAFSKLGELTMQLHPSADAPPNASKWSQEEIEMLRTAITRFGDDLQKLSDRIKNKTVFQIRNQLRKTAFAKAELPPPIPETVPPLEQTSPTTTATTATAGGREKASKKITVIKTESSGASQGGPPAKKQKTSKTTTVQGDANLMTLNALNSVEGEVDIETIGETATVKKLEFDSEEEVVEEEAPIM